MYNSYLQVCKRLADYRRKLNKTQRQVAKELEVGASQYCKYESGANGIPFEILDKMQGELQWDVDYIFTGVARIRRFNELYQMIENVDEKHRVDLYRIIFCGILALQKELDLNESQKSELKMLQICLQSNERPSCLYLARKAMGISQLELSLELGISDRKYGRMERNQNAPSSKLLRDICCYSKCRPSLFFSQEWMEAMIIEHIFVVFDQGKRQRLDNFVQSGIKNLF